MHIRDVTLRDGLQSEAAVLSIDDKVELYERLADAGLDAFQVTSFVSPRRIPQLADAEALWHRLEGRPGRRDALVANLRGYERARAASVGRIELVLALSPTYHRKNTHRSQEESFAEFSEVVRRSRADGIAVGVGLANGWHCSFEGDTPEERVMAWLARLYELGIRTFSLADTTGGASTGAVRSRVRAVRRAWPEVELHVHLHDAGRGVANALAAAEAGADSLDTALLGLGGSPFAGEVGGNLAVEALARSAAADLGLRDLDLAALKRAGRWLLGRLGGPAQA